MIAVRLGRDPYGFIGKFQGLSCSWTDTAEKIAGILIQNDRMFSVYIQELRKCNNWDRGNDLGKLLGGIVALTPQQINELVSAFNENEELHGSFAFNGTKPLIYGPGLVFHLNRLGTQKFKREPRGMIEPAV